MKFHLYGTSASGIEVSEYATTDENGVATFKNVLIAGAAGYTMEKVDTAVRYVIPDGNMSGMEVGMEVIPIMIIPVIML